MKELVPSPIEYHTFFFNYEDIALKVTIDSTFKLDLHNDNISKETLQTIHFHTAHEFFFVEKQPLNIATTDGVISFTDSIVVVPPQFIHCTVNCNCYRLIVDFSKNTSHKSTFYNCASSLFGGDSVTTFPMNGTISFYIAELDKLLHKDAIQKNNRIIALLTLLFSEILEFSKNSSLIEKTCDNKDYIAIIEELINSSLSDNINLDSIAQKLYLSKKQVSRIIKQAYGTKLSTLIIEKKLLIAQLLVEKTDISIKDIITSLNFNSENYFFTTFRKKYGCSPLQYRKEYRKES